MPRIRAVATAWLSSLVIVLMAPASRPAHADGDRSPWVDEGALPVPGTVPSAPSIPDPGTTAAAIEDHRLGIETELRPPSRARKWGSFGGVVGVYAAATTYMYFAWYHGQPDLPAFKFGGDGYFGADTYAGGADKVGHAWANLMWSRLSSEILLWGGWERWKAGAIGSGITLGLFTLVEVKDGFYYQFSPGDAIFNTLGAALSFAMVTWPRVDELIDFRVEYFPSGDYLDLVAGKRPANEDPTMPHQTSLNFVEDYSGQRYLLALHLGALPGLRDQRWAHLVDGVVGYETDRYKPDPVEPGARRSEHLFLGVSFNMQGLIDMALAGKRGGVARKSRSVGHLVFEVFNPPFASAAVVGTTRSPDD